LTRGYRMRSPVSKDTKVPSKAIPALHLSASHLLIEPFKKSYLPNILLLFKDPFGERNRGAVKSTTLWLAEPYQGLVIAAATLLDSVRETRGINQYRLQSRSIYSSVYEAFRRIWKPAQKENVNFKEYRTVGNLHPRRAYDRRLKMQRSSGIVLWSPSKAFGVNYIRLHNHS